MSGHDWAEKRGAVLFSMSATRCYGFFGLRVSFPLAGQWNSPVQSALVHWRTQATNGMIHIGAGTIAAALIDYRCCGAA
jgi:hypothetical protein